MAEDARRNTDRELWRENTLRFPGNDKDPYAHSIHVTESGGIGINCGGHVIVMPLEKWHSAAKKFAAIITVEPKNLQAHAGKGELMTREIHIVFDGPPAPESGRFVEVETAGERSISVGKWEQRGDFWRLILTPADFHQICERCGGTGAIDAPYSGSDPSCPDCSGEGYTYEVR